LGGIQPGVSGLGGADFGAVRVVHFQRRPAAGQVSIERVFAQVRRAMPAHIDCTVHISPHLSRGVAPRVANLYQAARHSGQVNHVTGDVQYLALALEGRRTLVTIHDCASFERLRGLKRTILRWVWYELPVRRAALVSVISGSTRRELLRYIRCEPGKIRVVHNCVGSEFVAAPKGFNGKEPVFLQVGTGANKNLARVSAALSGLHCRLSIVGQLTAEQRALLEERGIRYSNLPGATDGEVVRAYRECDAVVFASTYEGFGLPIVEGNGIGRPVVTSNVFSMPEVAANAACLVDPFEVESIRRGILKVWQEEGYRQRLVAAGFENVKRFSPRAIASQYAALYAEVAAANSRG
jgi:glycosyltransferase involved in cell wall biosynthesis